MYTHTSINCAIKTITKEQRSSVWFAAGNRPAHFCRYKIWIDSNMYLPFLSFFCTFSFCPFFLHCFWNFFFQIPVYLGASHSLLATPPLEDFYGKDGLGDFVYPDPPNPADYLKMEHAAVALARLASQYPSRSFLFLQRPPKDNSQIDPLHISVELLSSPFGVLLYIPLLSFSHSVHRHTGSGNHVGIFASDKRF